MFARLCSPWFFNGNEKEVSNSASFQNGTLTLSLDSYASVLKATLNDGVLNGEYIQRGKALAIHAVPASEHPVATGKAPNIRGIWVLEMCRAPRRMKGLAVDRSAKGAEVFAAVLRVDGDTGTLTGSYKDGKFILSHFSRARPSEIFITPQTDGTLSVEIVGQQQANHITAYRPEIARAKGLPEPTNASRHTGVKDPSQPFAFSFAHLNGTVISSTDEQFRDKVVLINITGSWCPNCHDEAPFLAEIYNKYHDRGLEIVALSFKEAEQLQNPTRLRAFIKEYGIKYTVLLGGETSSAKAKLTNTLDWDSWPTTLFVGRDGLVKGVRTGFPSPGSGEL